MNRTEAATLTGNNTLTDCADRFKAVADAWAEFGDWCKAASEMDNPADKLHDAGELLNNVADKEERAWLQLREAVLTEHSPVN